jgi:hypothetical protein
MNGERPQNIYVFSDPPPPQLHYHLLTIDHVTPSLPSISLISQFPIDVSISMPYRIHDSPHTTRAFKKNVIVQSKPLLDKIEIQVNTMYKSQPNVFPRIQHREFPIIAQDLIPHPYVLCGIVFHHAHGIPLLAASYVRWIPPLLVSPLVQ